MLQHEGTIAEILTAEYGRVYCIFSYCVSVITFVQLQLFEHSGLKDTRRQPFIDENFKEALRL